MLDIGLPEFQTLVAKTITKTKTGKHTPFGGALADEIIRYVKETSGGGDPAEDAYKNFFETVERDTEFEWRKRLIQSDESPFTERVQTIRKHRAHTKATISVYYWFHQSEDRSEYAKRIDYAAYDLPFVDKFDLWQDPGERTLATRENGQLVDLGPITLCFGRHPDQVPPELEWRDRQDIVDGGVPDLFAALSWKHQLIEDLVGREDDYKAALSWASDPSLKSSVRLISGPGGSGKTRLAAQVAREMVGKGWSAGFLRQNLSGTPMIDVSEKGLLLIVDYPEERSKKIDQMLGQLRDVYPKPLRILLLSRFASSERDNRPGLPLARVEEIPLTRPAGLEDESAAELVCAAAEAFADLLKSPVPPLLGAQRWVERHHSHRLPLFALAAGIHAVLEGTGAFELGGAKLMIALAEREVLRVRAVWKKIDKHGDRALERLLALGLLTGNGLSESLIKKLVGLDVGTSLSGKRLIDALRETSWWLTNEKRLMRLEPDRPAAAFLAIALIRDDADDLSKWMLYPATTAGTTFGETLSRLLFDLSELSRNDHEALEGTALQMLQENPDSIAAFETVAFRETTPFSARFSTAVCKAILQRTNNPVRRGALLNNLGNMHSELGRREEVLTATSAAVAIFRNLASTSPDEFQPDLANSLNNLANALSELGSYEEAHPVAVEAVDIQRTLISAQPDRFQPGLARSLNTLGTNLAKLGRPKEAYATLQEAITLHRDMAPALAGAFINDLAKTLNNLAITLSALGQREAALEAASETVEIQRERATARSDAFLPDLAKSLNTFGAMLSEIGLHEGEALAAAKEAAMIYRDLANTHPETFRPDLARSLHSLGIGLFRIGQGEEAFDAVAEAVTIRRDLAAIRPDAFLPDLAKSLINVGTMLFKLGQDEAALSVAGEAVTTYRELAIARPIAFLPDLATSLNNLAIWLAELGRHAEALIAALEAVKIRRELAIERPDAVLPDLAGSLNNLGMIFSELGRREEALAAVEEAVTIRKDLAAAHPDSLRPALAESLSNLGMMLSQLGRLEEALAAAENAVMIWRDLVLIRPEAFRPGLAMTLSILEAVLTEIGGREEDALAVADEAVRTLRPFFIKHPKAYIHWMNPMFQKYLKCCDETGTERDEELFTSIFDILQSIDKN